MNARISSLWDDEVILVVIQTGSACDDRCRGLRRGHGGPGVGLGFCGAFLAAFLARFDFGLEFNGRGCGACAGLRTRLRSGKRGVRWNGDPGPSIDSLCSRRGGDLSCYQRGWRRRRSRWRRGSGEGRREVRGVPEQSQASDGQSDKSSQESDQSCAFSCASGRGLREGRCRLGGRFLHGWSGCRWNGVGSVGLCGGFWGWGRKSSRIFCAGWGRGGDRGLFCELIQRVTECW